MRETARLTDEKPELTEDEKALLDVKLQRLAEELPRRPSVSLTYFQPDKKKTGGAYVTVTGQLRKIDDYEGTLILMGGEQILIRDVLAIK